MNVLHVGVGITFAILVYLILRIIVLELILQEANLMAVPWDQCCVGEWTRNLPGTAALVAEALVAREKVRTSQLLSFCQTFIDYVT